MYLNGTVLNSGVPAKVMTEAKDWIAANAQAVIAEWNLCNPAHERNPKK